MPDPHGLADRFLTLADVAELLNVELDIVRELVASNELAAIRIGESGQWRIERTVLEAYIDDLYERRRREAQFAQLAYVDLPELIRPDADAR